MLFWPSRMADPAICKELLNINWKEVTLIANVPPIAHDTMERAELFEKVVVGFSDNEPIKVDWRNVSEELCVQVCI